jgi:hypothetical protein
MKFVRMVAALSALSLLCACAADITRSADTALTKPHFVEQGRQAGQLQLTLTGDATKQLTDNLKFNQNTLLDTVRRALEANNIIAKDSSSTLPSIEILVTDVRVRSNFSAIMFGFMAGDDRIKGDILVRAPSGVAVQQFTISVSYALGGLAGGQDDARMSWLYESFAKKVVEELTGAVKS